MKKNLVIAAILASVFTVVIGFGVFLSFPKQGQITQYNKNGIKFSYFNTWALSKMPDSKLTKTINLKNNSNNSNITIEVRELPISYDKFDLSQIADAVNLQIEGANKDLIFISSNINSIGKDGYQVVESLYINKAGDKQMSVVAGKSGYNLFVIVMDSPRDGFDLMLYDLDAITDSLEL